MERRRIGDLCDLLNPGHLEEWSDRGLNRYLRFWGEIFETLSTEWAVFELSAIGLLDKPFSAVPTFHDWCYTHTYRLTSTRS